MPITRATNLAGLGTIFDSLTDGGGLSVSGISTFTDLNITRVNITGVGTISNGSITNLTGTSSTITTLTSTNGSITNLTGTAGTITTLRSTTGNFTTGNIVTGVTTNFNATNVVITGVTTVSAGTTALPSISPSGDPNTGIFFPAADHLNFSTGGTSRVQIESDGDINIDGGGVFYDATSNRLAIGNTSPATTLDVVGTGKFTATASLLLNGTSGTSSTWQHNGTSIGDLGTGNQVINGGSTGDFAFTSRAGALVFGINTTEKARIDTSGRLLVGTSSVINNAYGGTAGLFQVSKDDFLPIGFFSFTSTAADGYCPYLELHRARGTKASPTIVSNGDELGEINFYGYDGSTFRRGASIRSYVDAATGSDDMPGRLTFFTAADGGSSPTERMRISANGNVNVVGALSKGSGSFRIDHPLPEKKDTHHLIHSFIEGPQADLIYRGHVDLINGIAQVNIDVAGRMTEGTFKRLCTNVCCFTSNETDWTPVRGHVDGNILNIEAQDPTSTAEVCWMVIGERKDQHMLDTNWTDENGRVITEPLKEVTPSVTR